MILGSLSVRTFAKRPDLGEPLLTKLSSRTQGILKESPDSARTKRARAIFDAARKARWFGPVVTALRSLCGQGELCMYCSSNEPSQVEHYRPLALYPELAFEYENYLWSCDICNRNKGDKFPPDNHSGERILNPLDDDVWQYFFIDEEFGRLIKRVDPATRRAAPRAVSTCDVVGIDRGDVQIKRSRRYARLRRDAVRCSDELKAGSLTIGDLQKEIADWRSDPFQADVADYFLNGPGRAKEPFRTLLLAAGEIVP